MKNHWCQVNFSMGTLFCTMTCAAVVQAGDNMNNHNTVHMNKLDDRT
jgi:hypothetical protein